MDLILGSSEKNEHSEENRYVLSTETGQCMNEGSQIRRCPLPEEVVQLCFASKRGEPGNLPDSVSTIFGIIEGEHARRPLLETLLMMDVNTRVALIIAPLPHRGSWRNDRGKFISAGALTSVPLGGAKDDDHDRAD